MDWCLWLDDDSGKPGIDDSRNPPKDGRNWMVANTSKQAMRLVIAHGPPIHMDLDHDLGEPEDRMGRDNSMFFLSWLEHHQPDCVKNMTWNTHSRNPDCNPKMSSFLDSWKRSLELP